MRGGTTRDRLTTRLRTVWPEPATLDVSRLPRRGGPPAAEYLVLPRMSNPVLLLPTTSAAAAGALARPDEGQRAPAVMRVLRRAQQLGLLRLAPGVARVAVRGPEGLVATFRRLVPDADAIVVRLGRPRHGRAVVLQALDADGRSVAFAKCGRGEAVDGLRAERDHLHEVAERPVPGVTPPPVLGWAEEDGAAVLCLGALAAGRPAPTTGVPVPAMRALSERNGRPAPTPFGETPLLRRLQRTAETLAEASPDAAWLVEHAQHLAEQHAEQPVVGGSWHGDWVPWNMTRDGDQVLLWDWEHYEDDVLAGFDHLHFLAQTRRMRDGTDPAAEDAWLVEARAALTSEWGLGEAESETAIAAYLLLVNERYVADRIGATEPTPDRAGWSRDLLDRLAGATR